MKYKCIIFDCDGVLVDSEIITSKVLVSMAKELNLSITLDYAIKNFMGKSLNHIMAYIEECLDCPLPTDFETEYRKRTYDRFKKELRPIDGILQLIEKIEVPFCVASSGPLKKIKTNLTITNMANRFVGRMFSCYEINSWKPEPDIFLHAAKEMGFQPKECAVIEDSLVGVQAALAGGFDVFMYSKSDSDNSIDHNKVTVFKHMGELSELLFQ
ncbi:HAD-IA family hydrolase [Maribacter sp. 2304DJ31-5]|uniref:HAD-IA family hydrolase n=1 Tax=Maribacter sp. 2304DJ31-5 TaxID=3386273 RepID=UPI0039BCC33A